MSIDIKFELVVITEIKLVQLKKCMTIPFLWAKLFRIIQGNTICNCKINKSAVVYSDRSFQTPRRLDIVTSVMIV